jgi:hypothetical protein
MRNSRLRGRAKNSGVSSSPSESLVHRVGQPAVHALDNVAIGVERDGDRCVSEQFLDKLGVLACHEEYCSAGAAEIVESDLGQFRILQEGLEVATEEVGAARGPTTSPAARRRRNP